MLAARVRKLYVAGVKGKPSLVLDVHYGLWIGNESEEEVTFAAGEIAGFNLGSFEEKVVAGSSKRVSLCTLFSQMIL